MRFQFTLAALSLTIINNDGEDILNYEIKEANVDADIKGLMALGQTIQQEIEKAMLDPTVAAAIEDAKNAVKQ